MEQQRCEREQVKALQLIFKLIEHDVQLLHEFIACDGYAMIVKVCMTNRCLVGRELIKVSSLLSLSPASLLHTNLHDVVS